MRYMLCAPILGDTLRFATLDVADSVAAVVAEIAGAATLYIADPDREGSWLTYRDYEGTGTICAEQLRYLLLLVGAGSQVVDVVGSRRVNIVDAVEAALVVAECDNAAS